MKLETYIDMQGSSTQFPKRAAAHWPLESSRSWMNPQNLHLSVIRFLHLLAELVHIDMIVEVSNMALHMAIPRECHFLCLSCFCLFETSP